MTRYFVRRVETVHYFKEYSEAELVEMGVPPEVFTDGDLTADFTNLIYQDNALYDALTEDTERCADVQGSTFSIQEVQ